MSHFKPEWSLVLVLALSGCGRDADARGRGAQAGEHIEEIKTKTKEELEKMTDTLHDNWTDLKADIAKLEAEAKVRGKAWAESTRQRLGELREEADAALEKLKTAGDAGADEAGKALDKLQESFSAAKKSVAEAWSELGK